MRDVCAGAAVGSGPMRESAMRKLFDEIGAGNEARTRDLNLGKVALYQLSYSRTSLPVPRPPLRKIGRAHV